DWATKTCPTLTNAYDHDPSRIAHALPVAAAGVESEVMTKNDPTLGIAVVDVGLEQADVHVIRSTLLLLTHDEPADAVTAELEGSVAALAASLKADDTLGGRFPAVSRYWSANYEPPFMEFDDATKARVASFTVTIAELA